MLTRAIGLAGRFIAECTVAGWRRSLGSGLVLEGGAVVTGARLVVRERTGCKCIVGADSQVRATMTLERQGAAITIGRRTHIGGATLLDAADSISIGDDVLISFQALISDNDSHSLDFEARARDATEWRQGRKDWTGVPCAPVTIRDRAWIGARAVILKGVEVGEGGVVAAGSVVTRNVPPYTLVAGNPARVVRDLPRRAASG